MRCLNTIHIYIILKLLDIHNWDCFVFEYHTYLHHSQTMEGNVCFSSMFEYHTYLHHSQTHFSAQLYVIMFEYHTYLHHSQTEVRNGKHGIMFEYHTYLHHSQTLAIAVVYIPGLNTIHIYIILKPWLLSKIATIV